MAHLGHMYANGQGVPQSNETALEWFISSSDAGHPSGLYGLGYMYVSGQGVPQDHRRAFELFEEAAKQVSLPGLTSGWLCQMQQVALLSRCPGWPFTEDLCCLEAARQVPLLPSLMNASYGTLLCSSAADSIQMGTSMPLLHQRGALMHVVPDAAHPTRYTEEGCRHWSG